MNASQLDPRAVAASFGAASRSYDAAAWLQGAARVELLSRLELLRAPPLSVLDLGAGTGLAAREIKRHFRSATVTAADIAAPMLEIAQQRSRFWRPIRCVQADAQSLPFENACFDLVFSNLMLQWLAPPDAALTEIYAEHAIGHRRHGGVRISKWRWVSEPLPAFGHPLRGGEGTPGE